MGAGIIIQNHKRNGIEFNVQSNIGNALSPGAIFSYQTDLIVFWGPILIAFLIYLIGMQTKTDPFILVAVAFSIDVGLNLGHVLTTLLEVQTRIRKKISRLLNSLMPAVVAIVIPTALYLYSRPIFISTLVYMTFFHLIRQQYGWVMKSRRTYGESYGSRWVDALMVYTLAVVPFIYWQSELGQMAKVYFYPGEFIYTFSEYVAHVALSFHWAVVISYLGFLIFKFQRGQSLNWSKLSIFAITWIWWYLGLVVIEELAFFLSITALSHATPYLTLIFLRNKPSSTSKNSTTLRCYIYGFFSMMLLGALLWRTLSNSTTYAQYSVDQVNWIELLIWIPFTIHYSYDSVLWKPFKKDFNGRYF